MKILNLPKKLPEQNHDFVYLNVAVLKFECLISLIRLIQRYHCES